MSFNANRFKGVRPHEAQGHDALGAGLPVAGLACLGAGLSPSLTVCDRRLLPFLWASVSPLSNWDDKAGTS